MQCEWDKSFCPQEAYVLAMETGFKKISRCIIKNCDMCYKETYRVMGERSAQWGQRKSPEEVVVELKFEK